MREPEAVAERPMAWPGLTLGVPSRPEPPSAPRGATGAELMHFVHCQWGTLTTP